MKEPVKKINYYAALPFLALIWLYQRTLSPDHGPLKLKHNRGFCKFYPTCSEFARQTLIKEGVFGMPKIFKRILSCNPLSLGGVDLP
jgi:uncharacterized protein